MAAGTVATIILTGIVYLAPRPATTTTPAHLDVALGKLPQATALMLDGQAHVVPRHVAYVSALEGDVDPTGPTPDYAVAITGQTQRLYIWIVNGQRVTIGGLASGQVFEVPSTTTIPNRAPLTGKGPAAMASSFCSACNVAASFFETPTPSDYLGGVMQITAGTLTANSKAIGHCAWHFGDPKKPVNLAQQLAVDVNADPALTIGIGPYTGTATKTIKLQARAGVSVTIGSAPLDDVLQLGAPAHEVVDDHFALYYHMIGIAGKAGAHPLPTKVDPACVGMFHMGGANCPPLVQQ